MDLITLANDAVYQAAGAAGNASNFWGSEIGKFITGLLRGIGILVVLGGVFKSIKPGLSGKGGEVAKTIIVTLIIAAFCFKPDLITTGIDVVGNIVDKVLKSISSVGGK